MRSNSRNFLLSASASRSDDEQPGQTPAGAHATQPPMAMAAQQQYGYAMGAGGTGPIGAGFPRAGQHLQPTLGDLYCQVQEMETRLRHLEIFVFANPNIMRTMPVSQTTAINPQVANEEFGFAMHTGHQTADSNDKMIHVQDRFWRFFSFMR